MATAKPKPKASKARSLTTTRNRNEFWDARKRSKQKMDSAGRPLPARSHTDKAMNQFWDNVPKGDILEVLSESSDENVRALINTLLDPSKYCSLAKACHDTGVTLEQLNDLWRKHNLAIGLIEAADRLPSVIMNTAIDADAKFELCDRCDGTGTVMRPKMVDGEMLDVDEACPKCKGAREVRVGGDPKARDTFFKVMGVTDTQQGPLVAIQQNIMNESLEDTLAITQKLLQRPAKEERS